MLYDGENFTLDSLSNKFPTTTIQSATDCFRLGRTINQFRRLCLPSTHSPISVKDSEPTNSSINSLKTDEDDDALDELPDEADEITDNDEENLICEINTPTAIDFAKPKQLTTLSWEKLTLP